MNELIPWNDRYALGVEEIDAQHRKMIGIINKLYSAMDSSSEKEDMNTILNELNDYADYHFTTEEKYFEKFNYDETVEHVKSHDMYREKIAQFSREYSSMHEELALPFEMIEFLREWWTGHILGADRKYVKCFHEHGLK